MLVSLRNVIFFVTVIIIVTLSGECGGQPGHHDDTRGDSEPHQAQLTFERHTSVQITLKLYGSHLI